jgi:hypothetical protein
MPGYQGLADAALPMAALRRFAPKYTSADLVRYVASVRLRRDQDGTEFDIDPDTAENVLGYALGQHLARTPDPGDRFRAVIALLGALTESEVSSGADLDSLLRDARRLAEQWISAGQAEPARPSTGSYASYQRRNHRQL